MSVSLIVVVAGPFVWPALSRGPVLVPAVARMYLHLSMGFRVSAVNVRQLRVAAEATGCRSGLFAITTGWIRFSGDGPAALSDRIRSIADRDCPWLFRPTVLTAIVRHCPSAATGQHFRGDLGEASTRPEHRGSRLAQRPRSGSALMRGAQGAYSATRPCGVTDAERQQTRRARPAPTGRGPRRGWPAGSVVRRRFAGPRCRPLRG